MTLAGEFCRDFRSLPRPTVYAVVLPLLVLSSATLIATSCDGKPSLLQRASTQERLFMRGRRLSSQLETSFLFQCVRKVPSFATSRRKLATVVPSHAPLAIMPPSSVTPPTRIRPVFVFRLARKRPSRAAHALRSASLLVVDVLTSLCSRLAGRITNTKLNDTSTVTLFPFFTPVLMIF